MTSRIFSTISFLLFLWPSIAMPGGNPNLQVYESRNEFAEIRQNLVDAIINRGLVLDFNGHTGDMLKRTREDVGGKPLYRNAEYMVFCSATLSRKTMEANIQNIGYCPYIVTVYEVIQNPGTIYVGYRKLNTSSYSDPSLSAVEKMLDEIAREAVE